MNVRVSRLRALARTSGQGIWRVFLLLARIPLLWLLLALTVVAYGILIRPQSNTSFSIQAVTETVSLHVPCGMRIVWDLPPGSVQIAERDVRDSKRVSAVLRGGVQAHLTRSAENRLRIRWSLSNVHACRSDAKSDVSTSPSIDPEPLRLLTEHGEIVMTEGEWEYVSDLKDHAEHRPVLVVDGYVVIGGPIVQGAGYGTSVSMPMLLSGGIEARTPDGSTQQKRLIHSEQVEVGSQIDSHGCLSVEPDAVASCIQENHSHAQGFVHLDDSAGSPALGVQLSVEGKQIGVRQFGSVERRIQVLRWARWLSSSWFQILAAMSAALLTVNQLTSLFVRARPARSGMEG